jgi:hypothetical protein
MSNDPRSDDYKEKFRPDQTALDQEVETALAGVSMEELYGFDKPQSAPARGTGIGGPSPGHVPQKGFRRGRIVSVDKAKARASFR